MTEVITWVIFSAVWSFFYTKLLERRIPNPAVLQCGACGSRMHVRPVGVGAFLSNFAWSLSTYFVVWRVRPPIPIGLVMVLVMAIPVQITLTRIYYAYWRHRHPLRCGEGGHLKPAPTLV